MPELEKNWFDCIRSGREPVGNIDLSIKAHTVLCLAEMSERLGLALAFDPKTRRITTGNGNLVEPITYQSGAPIREPKPLT